MAQNTYRRRLKLDANAPAIFTPVVFTGVIICNMNLLSRDTTPLDAFRIYQRALRHVSAIVVEFER